MSLTSPRPLDPDELSEAGQLCLDHLMREEIFLKALAKAGQELQHALLNSDADVLLEAQRSNERLAQSLLPDVRQKRATLRQRLGILLGLTAEQVTVRALASRLAGPLAEQVMAAWNRTCAWAETVDALMRRNAALANYCLGFVQQCLAQITGAGGGGSRYGRTGTQVEASRGSILEARG